MDPLRTTVRVITRTLLVATAVGKRLLAVDLRRPANRAGPERR